jgi:ABC-2 type transport system permease protein
VRPISERTDSASERTDHISERTDHTSGLPPDGAPRARILDRGYRPYRGPRTGVRGAMTTVWRQSVQRALGIRRSAWAKVLPLASVAIAYVPAVVFIGVVALLPEAETTELQLPTFGEYFPFIQAGVLLFVSFVAPEILCTDRRTGMVGIYLASPLSRDTYVGAKAAAAFSVIALITIGPPLLMLVAYVLQGVGPDGPGGVASTLVRIVVAGVLLALLYTAVGLGVASLTDRKAFATAALLLLMVVVSGFVTVLIDEADLPGAFQAASLISGPFTLVELVHGEPADVAGLSLPVALAGLGAWTLLGAVVTRTRYQLLQVTR